MYRYETHMHTSEASACARSTGAEMAEKYKAEGYDGIFVTDHFFNGNTCIPRELPWAERVELFCKGYESALARGKEIGLDVFFGFEYGDGCTDFLIYGLDKQWLLENDNILDMSYPDFLDFARCFGAFAVQAHPFREAQYIKGTYHCPNHVDAVEAINASHAHGTPFDQRAAEYAKWYGLPVTAGSDAHNTTTSWFGGGVMCETRFASCKDYAKAVTEGRVTLLKRREDI